jgi:hypothetical protein
MQQGAASITIAAVAVVVVVQNLLASLLVSRVAVADAWGQLGNSLKENR